MQPSAERGREMRIRTAFAVVIISGIAFLGVPSAAADEPLPTPAETNAGTAPANETVTEPTPEPVDIETEVTEQEAEDSAAPTDEPAEPTGEESPTTAEGASGESTAAADQPPPAEEPGDTQTVEEGESTGLADSAAPAEAQEAATLETLATAAEDRRDPRASIGDVNCTNLTVPVMLDNSRSTEAVAYGFWAEELDDDGDFIDGDTLQVPAGASRIVNVPVTEDTRVGVYVYDDGRSDVGSGWYLFLTSAYLAVDCTADDDPHDPQARIGDVDCAAMTVDVTLDNSRSEDETTYVVTATMNDTVGEPIFEDGQTSTVPAGDVQTVRVPVTENLEVVVTVVDEDVLEATDGEEGTLAAEMLQVDCTQGDEPRASIGEVNCSNLTVPVNLDNTRSPLETTFTILVLETGDVSYTYEESFDVAAGAERVAAVPVPNNAEVRMNVGDEFLAFFPLGISFDDETFAVDCQRAAAGRAVPRLAVGAGALAATGANGLALPLAGLTLLAGGEVLTLLGRRRG